MIIETCKEIFELFRITMENCRYWLLFACSMGFLAYRGSAERKDIVYPTLFFLLVVFNPLVFLAVWEKVSYSHWRLIWLVPAEAVLALTAALLISGVKKAALRVLAGCAVLLILAVSGQSVYRSEGTQFVPASNAFRLPEEAVAVANILLEQEPEPRAVVSEGLYCYVRQYSADIHMMYGRDANGYIHRMDEEPRHVYELLDEEKPDFPAVKQAMEQMGYPYLVIWENSSDREKELAEAGFEKIGKAGSYAVYNLKGSA